MKTRYIALAMILAGAQQESSAQANRLDARALPLGDGRVSSAPKSGYVYSCMTQFRGGGAQHAGDWIRGATGWGEMTRKGFKGA